MRYSLLASVLMLASLLTAVADEVAVRTGAGDQVTPLTIKHTVYLNDLVLEDLKTSRPHHYAKAQQVLASGGTLCAPGAWQLWKALHLREGECNGAFLRTSNPPRQQISFVVDDTRYIALVIVKSALPEFRQLALDEPATEPGTR